MRNQSAGFSLIQLSVVMLVSLTLFAIFLVSFREASATLSATSSEELVTGKLRLAREMAISQRKCVAVSITAPDTLLISVQNTLSSSTPVEYVNLSPGVVFTNGPGGAAPDNLSSPLVVNAGPTNNSFVYFGDGSARASAAATTTTNCVIYLGSTDSSNPTALSAITVMGGTGRARVFHYDAGRGGWF